KPDGVVAFPGGTGTADMIRRAKKAGLEVWKPYPHLTDLWRRREHTGMPPGPSTFRPRDGRAALKTVEEAGYKKPSVEIGADGKITIVPKHPEELCKRTATNPWDRVLK